MFILLLVAFLLELVAFFSFASLALLVEMNRALQIVLYAVLLAVVISYWAIYMSPRAPKKLPAGKYYVAQGIIYLLAGVALAIVFNLIVGLIFIAMWIIDEALLRNSPQHINNPKD